MRPFGGGGGHPSVPGLYLQPPPCRPLGRPVPGGHASGRAPKTSLCHPLGHLIVHPLGPGATRSFWTWPSPLRGQCPPGLHLLGLLPLPLPGWPPLPPHVEVSQGSVLGPWLPSLTHLCLLPHRRLSCYPRPLAPLQPALRTGRPEHTSMALPVSGASTIAHPGTQSC